MQVDDYFITGILASNLNVTYEFFNTLYIINNNLVDQRFLGKQAEYTVFGHIPDKLGKMYTLWDHILKKQLQSFPMLNKANADLVEKEDFQFISDFHWDQNMWQDALEKSSNLFDSLLPFDNTKISEDY